MRREPLLLPLIALAAGILLAHFVFLQFGDLIIPAALAIIACLLASFFCDRRGLRLAAASASLALVGMAAQIVHRPTRTPKLTAGDGETVMLSGCVVNPPVFSPDREQFTLRLAPKAEIRLTANLKPGEKFPLQYGQRVEVAAKVRTPRNFQNPDAFDYAGYLAAQRIYWTGSVADAMSITVAGGGRCGSRLVAALYAVRTLALDRLAQLYPDDPHTAALLAATLLGETGGMERRWSSDFRVTGTYHALVISGQHVSVLAFTVLLVLRLLRLRRIPALGAATLTSWLYAFITGFSSPVVRAAGGFTLFLLASYFFRRTRILNVLAGIAMFYLLLDPDQLFDPSFQLSFLSAAAIAVFAVPIMERATEPLRAAVKRFDQIHYDPQVEPKAGQWRVELRLLAETIRSWTGLPVRYAQYIVSAGTRVATFVLEAMIVSACVQFGLALPMVSYFHRLSITGLSANIIVIPLLSLVVPLGFLSIVTGWQALAWLTKLLLGWAAGVAAWHAHFEPAWRQGAIPLAVSVAFAGSLVVLAVAIRYKRWITPALGFSLGLFAIVCWQPWKPLVRPAQLELTAIDVSQGDSLLVVFPDGETMLVDAGGFPGLERMKRKPRLDIGEDVVSPYLWSRRIQRLDYAVLTHGHSDHMGGLASILNNFRPRKLWIGAEPQTSAWAAIQRTAAADGVPIVALNRTSAPFSIGGAQVRVLAPSQDYVMGESPANDDSLVLEIRYRRRSILLTGDAERPIEEDLLASGELRPVTLLKIGHHGSKTSSSEEFLEKVAPEFALISDGYLNQFHHPHPSVLARLADHHAGVFRTDQRGLITFRTDGDKVEVETFR